MAGKVLMSQKDDHIGQENEDPSRTLDAGKPLYELGSHIGRYKLVSVLGEGGFGMVYLAEQQHPIKRLVALKLIKPGMDTRQVIARFETERQALAMLDHPNIAQVFDAGATGAGRPYFAMEYVKGIPITEYCDKYKLGTEQRLRLFIPLCQAIQHAHQKGIIHRDIKPSNAMVILHDEKPIPKIIDFGVAKALNQRLTERTLFTEQGQLIGTPEYMSPEQAELTGLDVDTRTDIYSLGVLLYELLTGCTPFDPEDLRSKGYGEMQRIICEQDPAKPSTRLTTLGGKLEDIAKHHSATVDQLRKSVRGDLDWIVMKALEKDRRRRYGTADGLVIDIEHHLNNEPVMARPPSKLYRLQKLVRRNKEVFAAVGAVAVVLLLGVIVSTWQAVRATQAKQAESRLRQRAQAEELAMRQLAYASDVSLAQQALAMNDLGRARRLLEDHRPAPGEVDLRGWEWRYLWQECRSDALGELCRYPNSAHSLAYSPDGRVLAVAGLIQGFVDIWDVPGRKRIATLQPKEGHLVAFSPRGDLLATDAGNQIRLWRTGTWDLVTQLTLLGDVRDLKFSPDGRRLASLSLPDEVTVWEVDRWTIVRRIRGAKLGDMLLGRLDFSPNGKALVIGDVNHRLEVVDLASGDMNVDIPEAHPEPITSVVWSQNGSVIASGSGYTGGPIQLWDAASGKPLGAPLEGHTSWISELIFSTDGLRLYSASADQTIRIWDVEQRRCLATLRGSTDEVYGLALSPDGTTLASACKDGVIAFWSALPRPEEEQPRLIALGRFVWPAFAPDSRVLAAPREGTVSLFDPATSKEIEQIPALGTDVSTLIYSPDGTLLVSGSENGKIRVWSCAERRLLRQLDGHKEPIVRFYFRADGRRLLSVDRKGKAISWDALTWQAGQTFGVEFVWQWPGAVSPDGRLLAIGAMGAMRWLNPETGGLLATTTGGHQWPVEAVAFSDDGSQVASAAANGTVALWDPSSFKLIAAFKGHMLGAHGVVFSPDGRRLATGSNSREAVKLWDLSTHRELMTLSGQGVQFWFVAFSPDDRWLAACNAEGRLHLWHAPSWAEIEAAEEKQESTQRP
jgi:WD40 repeat protein/serine/threonine protein kinase